MISLQRPTFARDCSISKLESSYFRRSGYEFANLEYKWTVNSPRLAREVFMDLCVFSDVHRMYRRKLRPGHRRLMRRTLPSNLGDYIK